MQPFRVLLGVTLLGVAVAGAAITAQSRDAPIPHVAGQSVSPSFEGWYPNDDGTFALSFGYFNRNFQQALDVPVGTDNRFEPGPADRGQPTHFLPRRQTGVFTVEVPSDFGDRVLTWSVTAGGETIAIPGHLRPEWRIDALHEVTSGNRPPEVRFDPTGDAARGPGGWRHRATAITGRPFSVPVWVRDDGVQKRPTGEPARHGVVWSKYRGPGRVVFDTAAPDVADSGEAPVTVTFSEPGDYVLRVLAWDDSGGQGPIMAGGFQCCWTNAYVEVRVESEGGGAERGR